GCEDGRPARHRAGRGAPPCGSTAWTRDTSFRGAGRLASRDCRRRGDARDRPLWRCEWARDRRARDPRRGSFWPRALWREQRSDAVDDLSQEIFVRMKQHADELRDESRVVPWLFRIARSVVTDHLRRRRDHASLDHVEEPEAETPEVNFNAEMASSFRTLMAA